MTFLSNPYLIITAIATTISLFVVLYLMFCSDDRAEKRVARIQRRTEGFIGREITTDSSAESITNLADIDHLQFSQLGMSRTLKVRFDKAGIESKFTIRVFLLVRFLAIAIPVVAACCFAYLQTFDIFIIFGCLSFSLSLAIFLPSYWLDRKLKKKQTAIVRAIPDFLDLTITCIEGGLSLEGAIQRVSRELKFAHPLLAKELDRAQHEIGLGSTPEASLQDMADRCDLEELTTLASFLKQCRKYGTTIVEAIRSHAESIREKREIKAEELAQKASVKILFPTLLFIFPSVFVVLAGPAVIQLLRSFSE